MITDTEIAGLTRSVVADTHVLVRPGRAERTIMLLHGIGSRAGSFMDVMLAWPQGPRLVAWDAPGYGHSKVLADEWPQAADYAARLAAVCEALDVRRVDVIGHSLGCLVAGAFGHRYQNKAGRMVFLSPALGYRVVPGALPAALQARITELEMLGGAAFAKLRAARLVGDAVHRPEIVAHVEANMASATLPGYAQAVRMLASGDLLADARHVLAPACIISGTADVITPPSNAETLFDVLRTRDAARGAGDRLHMVANAGHALTLEATAEVLRHLTDFFAEAP